MLSDYRPAPRPSTVARHNQEIKKGQAPDGITRIDTAKVKGEQVHATFDNKAALNKDGTWKHGSYKLTNEQRDWLRKNGWQFTDN